MSKTARECKRKDAPKKVTRRSGRVTTYVSEKVKRSKPDIHPAFFPKMGTPKELSPMARFEAMRPAGVRPDYWREEYAEDESLWPHIAEEMRYAVEHGEIKRWDQEPERATVEIECFGCHHVYEHELTRGFMTPACPACSKPHPFGVNLEYPRGLAG